MQNKKQTEKTMVCGTYKVQASDSPGTARSPAQDPLICLELPSTVQATMPEERKRKAKKYMSIGKKVISKACTHTSLQTEMSNTCCISRFQLCEDMKAF